MNSELPESAPAPAPEAPAEVATPAAPASAIASEPAPATEAAAETPTAAATPVADVTAELKALFPALFTGRPRPVKLRIQADIQERAPGRFSKAQLSAFLRRHTGSTGYLIALTQAKTRFDLDGNPAGEITEEHLVAAREELARRKGVQQERQQLEVQQRRNRAQLLWDFERTTLTEANFCALKGLPLEELPGFLELARKERAEAPPAPPREARRDDRGPRRGEQRPEGRGAGRAEGRPESRRDAPRGDRGRPQQPGPRPGQQPRRDGPAQARPKAQAQAQPQPHPVTEAPSAAAQAPAAQPPEDQAAE